MNIYLIDINTEMIEAWSREFHKYKDVNIRHGSIFDIEADAIVSPANSFGIMDGGLDGKLRDFFGMHIEIKIRSKIKSEYAGELPVGNALVTKLDHKQFKYIITAPTMRVPENVENTLNAYLAMRALLMECMNNDDINSVAIPGLYALSGQMPYEIVARQMRVAYERIILHLIQYSHWREEAYLQHYLTCKTDVLPVDLEER